jgi:hypothetical protein
LLWVGLLLVSLPLACIMKIDECRY